MNSFRQQANHNFETPAMGPSVAASLTYMLQRGQLFTASASKRLDREQMNLRSTGCTHLNEILGGGLSVGQLHEVQIPQCFVGESQLLQAPIIEADQHQQPVFWLNPPAQPCLTGLQSLLTQHYVLHDLEEVQLRWAGGQILQSLQAGVVLIWHPSPCVQTVRLWQRALQPASQCFVLVVSGYMPREARAYHTRLRIHCGQQQHYFEIIKRQGGWPTQTNPSAVSPVGT